MGNLNEGMVFGEVKNSKTNSPIEGARAVVTYIQADAGLGGQLRVHGNPSADTNEKGLFVIRFQWEPTQLGNLIEDNPRYHLSVIGPTPDHTHRTVIPYETKRFAGFNQRLYMVVSLRAVANGGVPDFRKPDSLAITIVTEIVKRWRDYRQFPAVRVMPMSPEMYALIGFTQGSLDPPGEAMASIVGKWDVTIGAWNGWFSFWNDGTAWWADREYAPRHRGKWWHAGSTIEWNFDEPGDFRTFSVHPGSGFVSSLQGKILPEGLGFFNMTRAYSTGGG